MSAKPETVGQYLVYEQLGRGGMATVHRAETVGIGGFRRTIALKRLRAHLAADEDVVKSFIHEATLASHLRHALRRQALRPRVAAYGRVRRTRNSCSAPITISQMPVR